MSGEATTKKGDGRPAGLSPAPRRPISFVVIRVSNQSGGNYQTSECIRNPLNELIVIDNPANTRYPNLTQAMSIGVERAAHELVAFVHEDVVLPDDWQHRFEQGLDELEEFDPNWGVLGTVGHDSGDRIVGRLSDSSDTHDAFANRYWSPVDRLDGRILVFHRDRPINLDPNLPHIEYVGRDVSRTARACGLASYGIDTSAGAHHASDGGRAIDGAAARQ